MTNREMDPCIQILFWEGNILEQTIHLYMIWIDDYDIWADLEDAECKFNFQSLSDQTQ